MGYKNYKYCIKGNADPKLVEWHLEEKGEDGVSLFANDIEVLHVSPNNSIYLLPIEKEYSDEIGVTMQETQKSEQFVSVRRSE